MAKIGKRLTGPELIGLVAGIGIALIITIWATIGRGSHGRTTVIIDTVYATSPTATKATTLRNDSAKKELRKRLNKKNYRPNLIKQPVVRDYKDTVSVYPHRPRVD